MSQVSPLIVRTAQGGRTVVRTVELLPNGLWRADHLSGIVSLYEVDPRPFFAVGVDAPVYA